MDVGILAIGTNRGLAVVDTVTNTVLHVLSTLTSLLYMTNPSKFTRQVTREASLACVSPSRPTIQRHSTSHSLPRMASDGSSISNLTSPSLAAIQTSTKHSTAKDGRISGVTEGSLQASPSCTPYTVVDCDSSITALEIVQLPLDKHAAPTLTLWLGTASGYVITYGINIVKRESAIIEEEGEGKGVEREAGKREERAEGRVGGGGRRRERRNRRRKIQLMPTGLITEQKSPIVCLQFLNEWGDRQLVPYRLPQTSTVCSDEGRRRSDDAATASSGSKCHYLIVVDEHKIKSFTFPAMVCIERFTGATDDTTLLDSQYFLCQDLPCLFSLTSSKEIIVHSLPGLKLLVRQAFPPLINCRVMSTFRVSGDGQALYMSSDSEIQRMCVQKDDRLNLPHCLPDVHVSQPDPQPPSQRKMDRLFGNIPIEMDRGSVFGESAGRAWMSLARRNGKSGNVYARSPRHRRKYGMRDDGTGEEREGERREGERGERREGERREGERREGERGERRNGERKEAGLSGQMNRNREALAKRKKALTEIEQKASELAGDADNFATLAEKLANKYR